MYQRTKQIIPVGPSHRHCFAHPGTAAELAPGLKGAAVRESAAMTIACEVIASPQVRALRGPRTSSAKQCRSAALQVSGSYH